jgi:hypothetical protein
MRFTSHAVDASSATAQMSGREACIALNTAGGSLTGRLTTP